MPIKGLSTRDDVEPRFKTIGKLRKGGPKRGNQIGQDLDHFRFTADDPEIVRAFTESYGEKPTALVVYFPFETMEENFSSWREQYGQNGLVKARCDGEKLVNWTQGARYMRGERLCELACKDVANGCPDCTFAFVGRLSVILPELWKAGHVGLVTVETHGKNDIGTIASKLVQYEPVTGKPFTLYRASTKIGAPSPDKTKRMAVTKSLLYLELTNEWLMQELAASEQRAQYRLAASIPSREPERITAEDLEDTPEEAINGNGNGHAEEVVAEYIEMDEPPAGEPVSEPAAPAPAPTNGNGTRTTEQIVAALRQAANAKNDTRQATDAQQGLIASKLDECFAGQDDAANKRHAVLNAIFGFPTTKALSRAQAFVTLEWLLAGGKDDTGDYPLNPKAATEAAAIWHAAMVEAGQAELPFN